MTKKWYVLHTYSGYENKVKKNLETRIETMGLENNVFGIEIPTEMVTEIKEGGRRVESEKKVFPGYVLVRMELDDRSWAAVRNTPGVTGFVGADGNPAPLTREEYNKIMGRTGKTKGDKKSVVSSSLEVGQSIKVVSGPLAEFDGVVSEVSPDAGKVKVMVSIFGRETPVELSFDQVAKI
ncbi:transcription termination/antitermination protein NusG [Gordonibacter sp. An230]|uniref:transcription termination/antitermination protein NusG n=1 Tax=Gordonibacter sp. An230 TaxID=1965592 RepID=UPI000B3A116E|nr:transcription termination/antitermination protein NusG [Gordonibacter sp. An230]OUO90047.1 transcription termination/antitermination protein NusG [Gordonibacter sp. An230]